MNMSEAVEILEAHNKWRRDKTRLVEMQHPHDVGIAIDTVLKIAKSKSARVAYFLEIEKNDKKL